MTSHLVLLERESDIYVASEQAALLAGEIGFDRYAQADIETAVSEICSNAIRHADGGWMAVRRRSGAFEVSVSDRGPGFRGPRKGSPGLGIGLEGARRLMGSLRVDSVPNGSRVTAVRPLPPSAVIDTPPSPWSVTAAFRTRSGQVECGDAVEIAAVGEEIWVGVADGLGSGPHAALAARRVLDGMQLGRLPSPAESLSAAHLAAGDTRGAAAATVHLDGTGSGVHAALGDVSCAVPGTGELAGRPGIVGYGTPEPVDSPFELAPGGALLIWSDGIRPPDLRPWSRSGTPGPLLEDAERIVMEQGSPRQDAVLVTVRRRNSP